MAKIQLEGNDFQENVHTTFVALRHDVDFTDVTLACEDDHQVEAHKVILAASSPFFHNMLKRNKHTHPLIYMRGIKSEDLEAIVDFLYYGETNIYHENLETFLYIAQELNLKGLNQTQVKSREEAQDQYNEITKRPFTNENNSDTNKHKVICNSSKDEGYIGTDATDALPKEELSGEMMELDDKIRALMVRGENMIKRQNKMIRVYVCKVCGKEGASMNIKSHIEARHIEGLLIPCDLCAKTFRSRSSLSKHNLRNHHQSQKGPIQPNEGYGEDSQKQYETINVPQPTAQKTYFVTENGPFAEFQIESEDPQMKWKSTTGPEHTANMFDIPNPSINTLSNEATVSQSNFDDNQIELDSRDDLEREDIKELQNKIKTMFCRGEKMVKKGSKCSKSYICKVCGKEGEGQNIKRHIHTTHLKEFLIPCNTCEKIFRTKHGLMQHISRNHLNGTKVT